VTQVREDQGEAWGGAEKWFNWGHILKEGRDLRGCQRRGSPNLESKVWGPEQTEGWSSY
jgi:hypothetical protein